MALTAVQLTIQIKSTEQISKNVDKLTHSTTWSMTRPSAERTSDLIMRESAVIAGKMYRASGAVRSVNQNAPPSFKDGSFSTIFDICKYYKTKKLFVSQKQRRGWWW